MVKRLVVDRRTNVYASAGEGKALPGLRPKSWYDVIAELPQLAGFAEVTDKRFLNLLDGEATYLSWGPDLPIVLAATLRKRLAYLCWGTPDPSDGGLLRYLSRKRLAWIVKRAHLLLVNDCRTKDELRLLSGREAITIPYLVDTDFYGYCKQQGRQTFVVVPGDKDRNEELICQLASKHVRVIRVSRNRDVLQFYKGRRPPDLVDIRIGVSYEELRSLYQRARAVLVPSARQDHAVGQTAALEAIACGAPVLISAGRTADLLQDYSTVSVCESRRPDEWLDKLEHLSAAPPIEREPAAFAASNRLASTHHPQVLQLHLAKLLSQLSK